ncbi:MAG: hydantoinase/oxoprolinase family protein [Desulfobulbaceae bacterium]|uniref:Hydantoinase/oxoprolinase family protein n=1 Tax=Candidatus Desulfobia pelagia TaxID=2841692 RepID=A0A8J6TCU7_9BACT|nr:hydantoinase/oxoprolinase family protein [Candidatus Desulfobia pelagia]
MTTENLHTSYAIGIDTGGTYTDAVLLSIEEKKVIATAKSPTTHHNLSIGISLSLKQIFTESSVRPHNVSLVAVSTTLATNAVVEDKGANVGLLIAGPAKRFKLPVVSASYLKGGHNHLGEEADPLDMEALVDAVQSLKGHVDAYAVCAAMSIMNPAHEQVMAKAISLLDPKPVFCSHEISDRPGIHERAATSVLNARLMPVMEDFLGGMQDALVAMGLAGNVFIIRGDASPMAITDTYKQAASTVASGPAATAWFGMHFSPTPDALIVDVGGTTTDITIMRDSKPVMDREGSLIGEWHTQIDAVKMFTVGAGGDSHVVISRENNLHVGPGRVLPLSMSENTPSPDQWIGKGLRSKSIMAASDLTLEETSSNPILAHLVAHGPTTAEELKQHFNMAEITLTSHLKDLNQLQLISEIGFTPTDALHVLGRLNVGNSDNAVKGAETLAKILEISTEEFCESVLKAVGHKIETAILDHILTIETGKTMTGFFPNYRKSDLLDLRFSIRIPIIGIGAVAQHLLPQVAERLGTEVVFPDHYEVGNALGSVLMAIGNN